jgi:hypothetical protein
MTPTIRLCLTMALLAAAARAQQISLNPTRPTVANAATIQDKNVFQVETGYDAYPQNPPGNQQTVDTTLSFAALEKLRLDFTWSAFNHVQDETGTTNGVGTITLGGKYVLHKEDYHHPAPGIAFQYEAELPTASQIALNNLGQQFTVLVNHHYGKDGDLDVIANGSIVQPGCNTQEKCSYGGQQSFALSYHLQKLTRLYAEVFGQNVSQSNTPPGTYVFTGFYRQVSDAFGIDGGVRFGVTNGSSTYGTTVGLVFGKRMRPEPAGK